MKLNLINKIYICISILLAVATVYRIMHFKSWDRYNYSATIVAPSTFPVYVSDAYFIVPGNDLESIDYEWVNNFNVNWDTDYNSSNHARSQRLPTKLVLKFASYRDAKFYRDTLDLPQAQISPIFKRAAAGKQFQVLSSYAGTKKGLNFVVGIANNGNIIVWLRGVNLEHIILKKRLKYRIPGPDDTYYKEPLSKQVYLNHVFENLTDSIKTKLNAGFDADANYIDTPSHYIRNNKELWIYQKKNGFID